MNRIRRVLARRLDATTTGVDGEAGKDAGYTMVVTVIILPVLLVMVALAVDVAYYYYRGVQLQRAADSAALAGVTRMPRFHDADLTARDVARRNGFVDLDGGVTVKTSFPPDNNKRFSVTIRDKAAPIFFGRIVKDHWDIQKKSTAEYVSNIPLGSVENAIGTGYLTGASATEGMVAGFAPQNFWLSASGPCAAKEAGDQVSAKWDGNAVNPTESPATTNISTKATYLCDAIAGTVQTDTQATAHLAADRDAKNALTPVGTPLMPALVANRDYSSQGYNYIVDVPCAPLTPGGSSPPPPCESGLPVGQDLVIQMYDPVFNPDSVQRFVRNQDFGQGAKPDKFGLNVSPNMTTDTCRASAVTDCVSPNVDFGSGNPRPEEVRLRTEVRLFPPDSTPLDYEGDVPAQLTGTSVVGTADPPYVTGTDVGATLRFGSCLRWTDAWTQSNGTALQTAAQASAAAYNTPAAATSPWVAEPTQYVDPTEWASADCDNLVDRWVTLDRIPAATVGISRGRFRVNVRTIDSASSFGTNSFSIRAFFVPSAGAPTFAQCSTLTATDFTNSPCPSVSGDSTLSVFAAVPDVSRFYMAKLSPAALYRNKQVIVLLWDPGEGGDQLQILRPRRRTALGVGETVGCTPDNDTPLPNDSNYCIQTFDWSIWNPGLNSFSAVDPLDVATAVSAQDVCVGKGQTGQTALDIGGDENSIAGCATTLPTQLKKSRNGYQPRPSGPAGKFNDRMVSVAIQIPKDYGCQIGTGITVAGNYVDCAELDGNSIPQSGWWKVKYIPKVNPLGGYLPITDRTTWSVQLLGDPVHLVTDG